jgi:hypothetical protein
MCPNRSGRTGGPHSDDRYTPPQRMIHGWGAPNATCQRPRQACGRRPRRIPRPGAAVTPTTRPRCRLTLMQPEEQARALAAVAAMPIRLGSVRAAALPRCRGLPPVSPRGFCCAPALRRSAGGPPRSLHSRCWPGCSPANPPRLQAVSATGSCSGWRSTSHYCRGLAGWSARCRGWRCPSSARCS